MKTSVHVSMSRCSDGNWHLEIADANSGLEIVRCDITPDEFSKIVGASYTRLSNPAEVISEETIALVGKTYEGKTELITLPVTYFEGSDNKKANLSYIGSLVKLFEVDGWEAQNWKHDLENHHNIVTKKGSHSVKIRFGRYV
jgi:hypothetical protein